MPPRKRPRLSDEFLRLLNEHVDGFIDAERAAGRRMSQEQLAKDLGYSDRSTLAKWLKGTNSVSAIDLERLCARIGLAAEKQIELFTASGYQLPEALRGRTPIAGPLGDATAAMSAERSAELANALRRGLPSALAGQAGELASLLVDALSGALSAGEAKRRLQNETWAVELVRTLAGKEVDSGGTLISFGANATMGDVTFRDVAGRDINNITIQLLPPPALPAAPSYGTLPPLPELVIGRDAILGQLKTRLGVGQQRAPGRPGSITTIHGLPGQGKTTLALVLGYDEEVRQAFPGGVLWADLGENAQVNLLGALGKWGEALQTSRVREAPDVQEATKRLAERLQTPRVLLIVDDVWEKDHGAVFAAARGNCPLIITTRAAEIAEHVAVTSNDRVRLPGLSLENGLKLLEELAPSVVQEFRPECQELVRVVDGLPLALQVAGRLLREDHELRLVDIRGRIKELIEGKLLDAEVPHKLVKDTNNRNVAALLRRSIDFLDPITRERFIFLGFLREKPATFTLRMAQALWETQDAVPTIRRLIQRGLLEPASTEEPRFQLHALLSDLAKDLLKRL